MTGGLEFGAILRYKREKRGQTLRQAAKEIGCTNTLVSLWEFGRCYPSPQYIPEAAKYIGFSERDTVWMIYKEQRRKGKYVRHV